MLTEDAEASVAARTDRGLLAKMLRIEWLGQTSASLCWIASVLTYEINSNGDWLQLFAATAWLIANIASLLGAEG